MTQIIRSVIQPNLSRAGDEGISLPKINPYQRGGHVAELTGLRCIAVAMVMLGHSRPFMPSWSMGWYSPFFLLGSGGFGVHIFFVLSGYLITKLFIKEHQKTGNIHISAFYWRRFLRIAPAFYVFLGAMTVLTTVGIVHISWQELLIAGCYLWNYAHLLGIDESFGTALQETWYLGHVWSLSLEEQFYWIWPMFAMLMLRKPRTALIIPVLILMMPVMAILSYIFYPQIRGQLNMMFHTGGDFILIGCSTAIWEAELTTRFKKIISSPVIFSILTFGLLIALPNLTAPLGGWWEETYGRTIEGVLIALLLLSILDQPRSWICRMLRTPVFVFIGTISYSLYLWQQFFSFKGSPLFFGFPSNIGLAIIAATLSYSFIERPFLLLKDRQKNTQVSLQHV